MTKLEQKIRESFEAWNAHDVDRLVSDYTDDALYEDVPNATAYHGIAERGRIWATYSQRSRTSRWN